MTMMKANTSSMNVLNAWRGEKEGERRKGGMKEGEGKRRHARMERERREGEWEEVMGGREEKSDVITELAVPRNLQALERSVPP